MAIPPDPSNTFLTDAELEKRWKRKPGFLTEQRAEGRGPPFVKPSPRTVLYRLSDVLAYERKNTYTSNAEMLVAADDDFPPEAA